MTYNTSFDGQQFNVKPQNKAYKKIKKGYNSQI